jgi:hypothetical protein
MGGQSVEAEKYLAEIVEPTILDFEQNPTSLRHAFLASVATFHTIDYIGGSRQIFRNESSHFKNIDRVAHAYKHVQVGKPDDPKTQPLNVDEVIRRSPASIGEFTIGISRIGDPVGGVTLHQDANVDLLESLKEAVNFLRAKL